MASRAPKRTTASNIKSAVDKKQKQKTKFAARMLWSKNMRVENGAEGTTVYEELEVRRS